jgi:aminoglycoside phosphotransferase (APT) family kinase protein
MAQPIAAGEWVATVWHYLPHPPTRPPAVDLAVPLRGLHAIAEPPPYLPPWAPVNTARRRLAATLALPAVELAHTHNWCQQELGMPLEELASHLVGRCDDLTLQVTNTHWDLAPGVIHGDAHVGNLIARRLCDFDSVSIGPREWDLVPLAHSATRFGDPPEPYHEFATAYGFDLTTSPVWPILRDVRELQLVTSVLDKLSGRPEVAQILGHRLRTYLAGDHSAIWVRYR